MLPTANFGYLVLFDKVEVLACVHVAAGGTALPVLCIAHVHVAAAS